MGGMTPPRCAAFASAWLGLLAGGAAAASLQSGPWTLAVGTGVSVRSATVPAAALAECPIATDVAAADGTIVRLAGVYTTADRVGGGVHAAGTLRTAAGSVLEFADTYEPVAGGEFLLDRTVTVRHAEVADHGFRTEFAVRIAGATTLADVQPFVPGMWYADATHTPPSGLIGDPHQKHYLFREDRLPLPLAAFRVKAGGLTVALAHDQPDGRTFPAEDTAGPVTDDRLRFASLGLLQDGGISVAVDFPGVEQDQSRVGGKPGRPPTQRFHPVREGLVQHYRARVRLAVTPDFAAALRDAWRAAYDAAKPPVNDAVPLDRVYAASIDVLDHYYASPHGVPGFPFAVTLPDGRVKDVSYQMGFVGEQLPCAAHLIAAGFERGAAGLVDKGERVVDFWAANCLTPAGLPRTWYDPEPRPHWRDYPTYTRVATDGMQGMLQAWRRMAVDGRDKPAWLACCRRYGDWLVAHQNADGSYARCYAEDGTAKNASPSAALHPVRFLVDLTHATGDARYLAAAKRAGDFGARDAGDTANYYGGTADNNDVKDKEAGWIALDSFLSLYEATGDRAWLAPACRAADYTETWTYGWTVPVDRTGPKVTLPDLKTTAGLGLIAVGHSGTDVFLAFAPYAYERLALYTNDPHYAAVARLLLYNPRQLVDVGAVGGRPGLGYATPGLLTEAFSLAPARGTGVNVWLPWCTAAVLDPMRQFRDAFGTTDLAAIDRMPAGERTKTLADFARRHGFPVPRR